MNETILIVDDDPHLLASMLRQLRNRFDVETALGAEHAMAAAETRGPNDPYAVVVADMNMPGMNGVEFLKELGQRMPSTVRIMLTGQADQQTAIDAVNKGNIFRFLSKPCPVESIALALEAGLSQFRLVVAERELLVKTLSGSVKVLTDVLALAKPKTFSRATRVRRHAQHIAEVLQLESVWQIEIASMLSQIGCVTLPETLLEKVAHNKPLAAAERAIFEDHPRVGSELIGHIPRLRPVADIIAYQEKRFDGSGPPYDDLQGECIPIGARILKISLDYEALLADGKSETQAVSELTRREGWYDPNALQCVMQELVGQNVHCQSRLVNVDELQEKMVLDEHILSGDGDVLVTRGHEVSRMLRHRLENYLASGRSIQQPFRVMAPVEVDCVSR